MFCLVPNYCDTGAECCSNNCAEGVVAGLEGLGVCAGSIG
jgi:hypothetical protein